MKKNFLVFLLSVLIFSACSNDDDVAEIVEEPTPEEPAPEEPEAPEEVTYNREDYPIQDFIWSAMNVYYLYKADTPELDESYFSDVNEYAEYLSENHECSFLSFSIINQRQSG